MTTPFILEKLESLDAEIEEGERLGDDYTLNLTIEKQEQICK